ncbi:MAG: hypothetical protein EP310_05070 [Bacteroidetes bacterium]|nr:MAG: hypothetical protein EP310_05070 [Bacteroidota bacterium]
MKRIVSFFIIIAVLWMVKPNLPLAQTMQADTVYQAIDKLNSHKQEQFYDSLKYKADQRKLTRLIYDFLISPPRPYVDKKALALNYYSQLEGKIISEIKIKSLDVFGPTFQDTSRTATSKFEKAANKIHTKSNLNTIEKLLLFKVGDVVNPEVIYENERLIRSLPYIKEINIVLEQDSVYSGFVKVLILLKDRFSFGATGNVNGIQSAAFEIYNNNIFGVGHEIAFVFAGHVNKQPYLGTETYYKIKNINGKFVDISFGYLNTYKSEGFKFNLNKPFITPSIKWGYGATGMRMFRANYIFQNDVIYSELPMDLAYYGAWGGHSFQVKQNQPENAQIVFSAAFNTQKFYKRPEIETGEINYFANRTFLLSGLTFTQRRFVQDELVYSYGITEDIPEGFKNEIVYGYDINEFGNRHYAHLFLSNGNLLINKKGYFYMAGNIGTYYSKRGFDQGQIDVQLSFISKQIHAGQKIFRLFAKTDYTVGMHRLEVENLNLSKNDHIRGFSSREAIGKQRLSLNLEYVLFLRREFYKFNMALFGFADVGVIGSNKEFILTQNYYSGLGMGIRLHNENLVFKTIQLRLAFYPFHPHDMSFVGFVLEEQSKKQFYSFEPTQPAPLRFE